jgi:phage repressor protein C with HTH and peptisase S24 domain
MIHTRETLLSCLIRCMDTKGLSLREMARQMGVTYDSLKDFKWGRTQMLRGDNLQKVVMFLGESYQPMIPIVGYVGAGGEVRPIDDYAIGGGLEEVECPPGVDPSSVVALRIRGDSMHPVFQSGWVVYYSERMEIAGPPSNAVQSFAASVAADPLERFYGKPCVIKTDDDRVMLKTLKKGHSAGRFTLTSYNATDIEGVSIQWAARIIFVKIV